jgi:TIR domain
MQPGTGAFRVFLSHKYGAPEVNLFFFRIMQECLQAHFEVDKGKFTSVTRIERAVRGAEIFVGIYAVSAVSAPSRPELLEESRYLRFELDIAVRCGKSGLLFVDQRYGNIFPGFPAIEVKDFDRRELEAGLLASRREEYKTAFIRVRDRVLGERHLGLDLGERRRQNARVGMLAPDYPEAIRATIRSLLEDNNCDVVELRDWNLGLSFQSEVRRLDWAIVDIGRERSQCLAYYLHGCFVPLLRLRFVPEGGSATPEPFLFKAFEVGYPKDIVVWTQEDELREGLAKRLARITTSEELITNEKVALAYFQSAAQRDEVVFISYSGKDRDQGKGIAEALRKRFKEVFDYRDDESLTAGMPWLPQIYNRLSGSKIGILLLSDDYFNSDYCRGEAEFMVDKAMSAGMSIVPVRLKESVDIPSYLSRYQNLRGWKFESDYGALTDAIIRQVDDIRNTRQS